MRAIILFQLLLLPLSIHAADVYKYTDPEGKIYFSNKPLHEPSMRLNWKRDENKLDTDELDKLFKIESRAQHNNHPHHGNYSGKHLNFDQIIRDVAAEENLHPHLLHAVVLAESGFRPQAVSPLGARGLMQLMPATARRFQVSNIHDPVENLRGGARYLRHLLDLFDNDLHLALAAYNTGEYSPSLRSGQMPSNAETRRFVKKVQLHIQDAQDKDNKSRSYSLANFKPNRLASNNHESQMPVLEPWFLTNN